MNPIINCSWIGCSGCVSHSCSTCGTHLEISLPVDEALECYMDSPILMMVLKFLNSLIMFEFHVLLIEEFEINVYFIYHICICLCFTTLWTITGSHCLTILGLFFLHLHVVSVSGRVYIFHCFEIRIVFLYWHTMVYKIYIDFKFLNQEYVKLKHNQTIQKSSYCSKSRETEANTDVQKREGYLHSFNLKWELN
jgi:prepilin signal peptidase PulO-like enzyme (type II secretory pathway)